MQSAELYRRLGAGGFVRFGGFAVTEALADAIYDELSAPAPAISRFHGLYAVPDLPAEAGSVPPARTARPMTLAVKRTMDVAGALALLLVLMPALMLVAVGVKATSRGPVFFRQRRLGLNGVEFKIFKFRTMCNGAHDQRADILHLNEQDGAGVLFKIKQDPRVTRIGGVLRRLSIDELPQLLNVLGGSMSLVGPRPLAAEDSNYTGQARRRLSVRPGITGLWQISGRSELSWDDAVRLDLEYVDTWRVGTDVKILFRTLGAVAARKGAY